MNKQQREQSRKSNLLALPKLERVHSTSIKEIGYDDKNLALYVRFHENGLYIYYGVARETFEEFRLAPSKGTFFNERILDKFRHAVSK